MKLFFQVFIDVFATGIAFTSLLKTMVKFFFDALVVVAAFKALIKTINDLLE